jgi:hypothetical protein
MLRLLLGSCELKPRCRKVLGERTVSSNWAVLLDGLDLGLLLIISDVLKSTF